MRRIHPESRVPPDAAFDVSGELTIEQYAVIGRGFKAHCRHLRIGRHTFIGDNVEIGGGGSGGLDSTVMIGPECCIAQGAFINCAAAVFIGRHVAFGYETQVWTHSVWGPVVDGFPMQKQEPVYIGDEVWLPSRCQVLPGVRIGDNVVVGMGSLVNESLPAGCLAVGRPCKPLRMHQYPRQITVSALRAYLGRLITEYQLLAIAKGFLPAVTMDELGGLTFEHRKETVHFDPWTKTFTPCPDISEAAEDFRDFLRRNGVPFYGGGFFQSLPIKESHG